MSHQPERAEKDCLNCGTIVQGKYCHVCGQENIVTHQNFGALIKHFVYDIFHFDGKFFDTLKYLLFKPGNIVREYINGKRMSFLDPIRMYLFTSAVFFLIFFAFTDGSNGIVVNSGDLLLPKSDRLALAHILNKTENKDSIIQQKLDLLLDTSKTIYIDNDIDAEHSVDTFHRINYHGKIYVMRPRSNANNLEIDGGNGWAGKTLDEKWKKYKKKHGDDINAIFTDFSNTLIHRFPYMLFLSLPFFALILKILYTRRKILYSEHAIFTLYHYIFSFIILLLGFGFYGLNKWTGWGIFITLNVILFFVWSAYLLLAMKRFYSQKWLKTIFKFLALNFLAFIVMALLFVGLIFFSIFQL